MKKIVKKFLSRYKFQICIFLGIFLFKTIVNLCFGTLVLTTGQDEFGTIAGASYFAGFDWSGIVSELKYYGFGYSMLMAPVYWIFDNPRVIFQVMIAFNSICLGVSGVICYNIIRDIFNIDDNRFNVIVSITSTFFSCILLNSNAVFNECALMMIEWILVYLLLLMQKKKDAGQSTLVMTIVFSLISIYGFTVHTRIIYVLGASFIFMVMYFILKRKILVNIPAFVGIMGVGYIFVQKLIKFVQLKIWLTNDPEKLRNSVSNLGGYFGNVSYLKSASGIKGFVYTLWGQVYGMFSLSGGIFAIAICIFIFIILSLILKKKMEQVDGNLVTLGAFLCSLMMAVLLLTALGVLDLVEENVLAGTASRWYLYTRYWAMCGQITVMFVLVFFKKQEKVSKILIGASVAVFALVSLGFVLKMGKMFYIYQGARSNAFSSYLGMLFMKSDDYFTTASFWRMTIFAAVIFVISLICIKCKKAEIMAVAVLCLFIYSYAYTTIILDVPTSKQLYNEFDGMKEALEENGIDKGTTIYCNPTVKSRPYMFGAQFNLYEYKIIRSKVDDSASQAVVISDSDKYSDKGYSLVYKNDNSEMFEQIYVWAKGY